MNIRLGPITRTKLITKVASDDTLNAALAWVYRVRKNYPAHDSVWGLKSHWPECRAQLRVALLAGNYQFSPLERFDSKNGQTSLWNCKDAIVLKALSLVLQPIIEKATPKTCFNMKNHGGVKGAIRKTAALAATGVKTFIFKSDVAQYYASINHFVLYEQFCKLVTDKAICRLVWQYMRHVKTQGGNFSDIMRGISRGCPLSPLMGSLYLIPLDRAMARMKVSYIRYMDDWVIFAKTRHALRRAILTCHKVLKSLQLRLHPGKTFIGRVSKGFDFLGYRISPQHLSVAQQTTQRFQYNIAPAL